MSWKESLLKPHRLGAIFYLAWALMHLWAARGVYDLALKQEGLVMARLLQDAAYMLVIAVATGLVALAGNWRNRRWGYWFNLILVSVADVIFIVVVVMPGHVGPVRGSIGPALWILALIFSTVGILSRPRVRGAAPIPAGDSTRPDLAGILRRTRRRSQGRSADDSGEDEPQASSKE